MPALDGQNIFGLACKMRTVDNPRAQQQNAYPGLSGLESLDQGLRGRFTSCEGILYGANSGWLATAQATFRSFNDGAAHVLVDSFGVSWANVKLEAFEPQGRVQILAGSGVYFQKYTARFLHLS